MLCIEFQEFANSLTVRMEGRLVGRYATDASTFIARSIIPRKFVVDVSELTSVDHVGEQVLSRLERIGARFVADWDYARSVCERLRLPLARKSSGSLSPAR